MKKLNVRVQFDPSHSGYFLDLKDVLKGTSIRTSRVKFYTVEECMDGETGTYSVFLRLFDKNEKPINFLLKETK